MFEQFREKFPLTEEKWAEYVACFKRMDVPLKTVLLREGDVPGKLFVVEKGCLRIWMNNEGKDLTIQFFFENQIVASLESFRKGTKSPVSIESVEPSVIWYINKQDADRILMESMENEVLRNVFVEFIFERTFNYVRLFAAFVKDTPRQRYLNLLQEKPELIQRIPQHYIASYLGITTVHLSRIKSALARNKR